MRCCGQQGAARDTSFGVSPVGHLNPIRAYLDRRLLDFTTVWAAAGTPRHVFAIDAHVLPDLTGAVPADFTA